MEFTHIVVLSIVQGLTEFLPISSSAHLILAPLLFGYQLQSLAFDVAVHLGTLFAVMLYFRRELGSMGAALMDSIKTRSVRTPDARLATMILVATIPIVIFGLPLKSVLELLRQDDRMIALFIASTTIGFGLLLWIADASGKRTRDEYQLGWKSALLIGLFQAIAIIPGTSRSGITMTVGLFLGLTRQAASRYSFLLAIPTILLAGGVEILELLKSPDLVDWYSLSLGALLSFAAAYLTIHFFLRFIERISMFPFVLYRAILGSVILFLVY